MLAALEIAKSNPHVSRISGLSPALKPVVARRSEVGLLAAPRRTEKRWRLGRWLVVGVVAVAAAGAAYDWRSRKLASAEALFNRIEGPKTVKVARPAPATTASVTLPATVRPWQTTELFARVSGYLVAWRYDLGSEVKAGTVLAEIETPELDQELAEAEAQAIEAAASVVQAKAERAEARADLSVAEAQLVKIQAETELAKSQLARREKLLASRAVARDDYDTFATQVDSRTAEVEAARSEVTRRRTNLETRAAIIAVREATAKARRASVDRLKELTAFKRIVAPFDGVVTRRSAEVGMLVTAGKESLFSMEDMSRVRVQVSVPQAYSQRTVPGAEAAVSLPESTGAATRAKITRTASSVASASRTMLAEIELDNASRRYQPGSYVQVALTTDQGAAGWTIPTNTLSMKIQGPHVAVVDGRNQIELRRVTLGRDLGSRVIVLDGIRGGERLVVNPSDRLANGDPVSVSDEAGAVARR